MRQVHQVEIKVGLLVLAGLIVTCAMILTADRVRIERTYRVTALLRDAGGLRIESPVTLSGIPVGKIESIEFTASGASGRPVRAVFTVLVGIALPAQVQARLATSGVFGDASLALAAPPVPSAQTLPVDGSATVEVQPGFLDAVADRAGGILASIEDLLDAKTRADAKRLLASTADLATHASAVAARLDGEQERIARVLDNLDRSTGALATTAEALDRRLDPLLVRLDETLAKTAKLADSGSVAVAHVDGLVVRADALIGDNRERVAALLGSAATAADHVRALTEALQGGSGVLGQLLVNRDLAKDLQSLSVDLAASAQVIADKPSRLVFDDADSVRQADRAKRNREKMRRTLAEGLGQPLPATPPTTGAGP